MGKVEEKKKQKQEALLESAFALFTERGVDYTSVSDITRRANMAKGTFYLYFRDKYEIRDYLIGHQTAMIFKQAGIQLHQWLDSNPYDSLEECVIYLVNQVLDILETNPTLLKFISKNLSWGIFSALRVTDMDNQNYIEIFDTLIEKSPKKYRSRQLMIYMIVELINATCYNVILHQSPVKLPELKEALYPAIRSIIKQFECNSSEVQETAG